jgi:hypothetical protein
MLGEVMTVLKPPKMTGLEQVLHFQVLTYAIVVLDFVHEVLSILVRRLSRGVERPEVHAVRAKVQK